MRRSELRRMIREEVSAYRRRRLNELNIKDKLEIKAAVGAMKIAGGGSIPSDIIQGAKLQADEANKYKDDPEQLAKRLRNAGHSDKDVKKATSNPAKYAEMATALYDALKNAG